MKVELKSVIEALEDDANQLEHHSRKLTATFPLSKRRLRK